MQVYLIIGISCLALIFFTTKIFGFKLKAENINLQSKLEILFHEYNKLSAEYKELQNILNQEKEEKYLALQREALALQKCDTILSQMKSWEEQKAQSIENAKAAIFDVGNKLSKELIEHHKRESQLNQEETKKQFKETTENIYKNFSSLTESVTTLKEQVTTSHNTTDMVYKALLAPNTVGGLAEITLENILKSSNLLANIDYHIQHSVIDSDNNKLRPDAIIYLPGDNILVIDSKASKFFLELGLAKSKEEEIIIRDKIKNTMRNHLKSLSSKDYRLNVSNGLNNKNVKHISTIMFLPTESTIEQLQNIDNQFINDAWKNHIFPAGPVGLINILANAKFQISEDNKNKNYNAIIEEVSHLLYNIANLTGHAKKLGSSLNNSISFFDKFAASFNSNILSRSKKLEKLGISVKTNKQLAEKIDRYQVITTNKLTMIEAEASETINESEENE